MYGREKSRKHHQNEPSFSSTLLDEIYRSIDDNTEDSKFFYRDKLVHFRGNGNYSSCHRVEDEEMAGFRRACLVEKWMLKEENDNGFSRRDSLVTESENKSFQEEDLLYFSSNSSSSDSSGALSSSSDTEFFSSSTKSRVSCFSRPKPVRIGEKPRQEEGDHYKIEDDKLLKSKSRALKIYAHLRKVKQPISPGGKLTSFINSLFNHANEKKLKNADSNKGIQVQDSKSIKTSSNCSSASSFSRSCLSKDSTRSREKMRNGVQRTVRFDPVSVIFNEESRPCGSNSINGEDSGGHSYQLNDSRLRLRVKNRKVEEDSQDVSRRYHDHKKTDDMYGFRKNSYRKGEEDDDDAISDSSSDLFEIDHLSLFGNNRFYELPMYETTHYGTNRDIGGGLIR